MKKGFTLIELLVVISINKTDRHNIAFDSCGESDASGLGCNEGTTWKEAKDLCESVGARLCTIEETENNIPRGTGCGFDSDMVWTMSPCESGMYIREGNYDSNWDRYCQKDLNDTTANGGKYSGNNIAVRCCADDY
ncbi:type II secretion system protein [Candidatus Parcubacteria bacterium]|nr:type II secretion system protein [Candidatus Parcubacteria bacterium]